MKNKIKIIMGYILITPFTAILFFTFIILPFMGLTNILFEWFSDYQQSLFVEWGKVVLILDIIALFLYLTNLGLRLIDKND